MDTDKIYAEAIASEYAPKDTTKVQQLRRLDRKAKQPAAIFAYAFGTAMALMFGTGMCLSMHVIGGNSTAMMVLGIVIGLIGIAGVSVDPIIYRKLLRKGKQKYAFEIMELAREISDQAE